LISLPIVEFKRPTRLETLTYLSKRLTSLELARSALSARRHQHPVCENQRSGDTYWLTSNRDLLHPLSDEWVQNQVLEHGRVVRCSAEEEHLAGQARMLMNSKRSLNHDELVAWLCEVSFLTKAAGSGKIREINVFTSSDRRGSRAEFSGPEDLHRQIFQLSQALYEWRDYPGFRALLVLVGVLAIHPFVDGNGRTARACFNALLFDEECTTFVPLRMIFDCSQGGFDIRLRDTVFNGNWGALTSYFCTVLDLC